MSGLRNVISAWIAQANSPIGTLPDSTDPAEWVADRFLEWWEPHTRDAIEQAEGALAELRQAVCGMTPNGVAKHFFSSGLRLPGPSALESDDLAEKSKWHPPLNDPRKSMRTHEMKPATTGEQMESMTSRRIHLPARIERSESSPQDIPCRLRRPR